MKIISLGIVIIGLAFAACAPAQHHNKHVVVHEYRYHHDDSTAWIYWYYIYDSSNRPLYWYASDTPVTNYSNIPFTRVSGELPKEAQDAISDGEPEEVQNVAVEALSEAVQADTTDAQIDAMVSEGGPPTPVAESTSSESASSDSGSSSGDSGGGGGSD